MSSDSSSSTQGFDDLFAVIRMGMNISEERRRRLEENLEWAKRRIQQQDARIVDLEHEVSDLRDEITEMELHIWELQNQTTDGTRDPEVGAPNMEVE